MARRDGEPRHAAPRFGWLGLESPSSLTRLAMRLVTCDLPRERVVRTRLGCRPGPDRNPLAQVGARQEPVGWDGWKTRQALNIPGPRRATFPFERVGGRVGEEMARELV